MLKPQSKEIPLRFGLDLTEDEEGAPNGAASLVNFDFDQAGVLVRRPGFVYSDHGPGSQTSNSGTAAFANSGNKVQLVQRAESQTGLKTITTLSPGGRRVQNVSSAPDHLDDYTLVAASAADEDEATSWAYIGANVPSTTYLYIVHNASGRVVWNNRLPGGWYARVEGLASPSNSNRFWHLYVMVYNSGTAQNDLVFYQLDGVSADVTPELAPTFTLTLQSTLQANVRCNGGYTFPMDASTWPGAPYASAVVYLDNTGNIKYRVNTVNTTGSATAASSPGLATGNCFVWAKYSSNGILNVVFYDGTNVIVANDSNGTSGGGTWADTTVYAAAANFKYQVTVYTSGLSSSNVTLILQETAGITWALWSASARTPPASWYTYSRVQLASQAFALPRTVGNTYYTAVAVAPLLPSNVTGNAYPDATIISLGDPNAPPAVTTRGRLAFDSYQPPVGQGISSVWHAGALPTIRPTADPAVFRAATLSVSETGAAGATSIALGLNPYVNRVRLSTITAASDAAVVTCRLQNTCVVSGSVPLAYDGYSAVPLAFTEAPRTASLAASVGAGPLTGTFNYMTVLEYTDVNGTIQVSPPSSTVPITVTAKNVEVTASADILDGPFPSRLLYVRYKLYRTEAGGTTYYLVGTKMLEMNQGSNTTTANTAATLTFTDNVPDSSLTTAESIYSDGAPTSPLVSETVPPLSFVWTHRNRLFGVRSDIPEIVQFTTEVSDSIAPRFNAVLSLRVDNQAGPVLAGGSLVDKVALFQENQICIVTGEGPDGNGNGTFSFPEAVGRVGVMPDQVAGVVETPTGIFFPSRTGIHLLTPDLQVVPVGAALGDRQFGVNHPVVRARYLATRAQVWFMTATTVYVYDLRLGLWTTFTGTSGTWAGIRDVTEYLGAVLVLAVKADGSTFVLELSLSTRADADATTNLPTGRFTQHVIFPWFRVDRAQALRNWKLHISGRKTTGDGTSASVAAEIYSQSERNVKSSTSPDSTYTWSAAQITSMANNFLISGRLVTQQCRAFRVGLTVTPEAGGDVIGDFLTLSSITYDFGVMGGRGKQPAGKRPTNT